MSKALDLPDSVYSALQKAAEESGTTPADWIAARLPEAEEEPEPRTLADLFAGRVGRIRSGGRETLSENTGERFAEHLERKRREGTL